MPAVIADAWRLGRVRELAPRPRAWISAAAAVLMVLSCVGLVGAGRRVWAGADLISSVFGAGKESAAADGRYNVLLLGGDAGPDRIGTRPDSMTLASIDATTGRTVLFSLPRNLEDVPFAPGSAAAKAMPEGWSCGDDCLLNGIYTWGTEHRSLFPGAADPGAEAMKQAVEGVTGLRVNYYVLIDLKGFSSLIDAMGGIRVTVPTRVPIGGGTSKVSGYIEPGTQLLDGYHALWFARSRHGASDYERMARQRCVMDAMVHQLDPATVLAKFQAIAAAGKQVVSTDVPAGELATFLDLAAKAKSERISSVQFVPPLINPARPDYRVVRAKVEAAIDAAERPTSAAPSSSAPKAGTTPRAGTSPRNTGTPATAGAGAAESSDIAGACHPA
jgi:LCP family protein required for cell wall assembly